jgi:hypothetical protein
MITCPTLGINLFVRIAEPLMNWLCKTSFGVIFLPKKGVSVLLDLLKILRLEFLQFLVSKRLFFRDFFIFFAVTFPFFLI